MKKWEYNHISAVAHEDNDLATFCNEASRMAQVGWRLVSSFYDGTELIGILEREIPEPEPTKEKSDPNPSRREYFGIGS